LDWRLRLKLLISIATAREIGPALGGGAQILDVKNPALGSLGAADPAVVRASRLAAPPEVPVSAALGDRILDGGAGAGLPVQFAGRAGPDHLADLGLVLASSGAAILKVGLAGLKAEGAVQALTGLRERLDLRFARPLREPSRPPPVRALLVAVAFADLADEDGILPGELPEIALQAGADGAMLDTLHKGPSLLEILGEPALVRWVEAVRDRGLLCGLAGSLAIEDVHRAAALGADVVGLRGAVCAGGRGGRVVAARVRRARAALEKVARPLAEVGSACR